jgi:rod shape-determining protein MreC
MFTLRRWWDRHRLQIVLTSLALGSALLLRQTGAAFLFELYQLLTRPFQPSQPREVVLENAKFRELQQRLTELESQNQKLQELIGYTANSKKPGIAAPVVGRSADHWWQQIVLGRGSQDGVRTGYVVMAPGGVVGRVTSTTANSSRVLLLSDPSSRVGVTLSRSRNMGYMRGLSTNRAVMEFFDKVPDVRKGDVVSTSSLSQLFPAGLPVGRIESVNMRKSPAPEAVVELTAPVGSIEWTVVYSHSQTSQNSLSPAQPSPRLQPAPSQLEPDAEQTTASVESAL